MRDGVQRVESYSCFGKACSFPELKINFANASYETFGRPIIVQSPKTLWRQLIQDKNITNKGAQLLAKSFADYRMF